MLFFCAFGLRAITYDEATNMLGVAAELQAFPKCTCHDRIGLRNLSKEKNG